MSERLVFLSKILSMFSNVKKFKIIDGFNPAIMLR